MIEYTEDIFENLKSDLSDELMRRQLSKKILVLVRGIERQMSLASYFVIRKDPKLHVKLPNGRKPLIDPRRTEKEIEDLKKTL